MAVASWMFRGKSLRSGRSFRSRIDAEDDIQLDLSKDACECARQILSNICKKQGLTEGKKFGYLNAFVKLIIRTDVGAGDLGYTIEEIQCCLRVALVHDSAQVRAAALRALRYLMKEERDVRTLNRLQYPFLIARSLDVNLRNDMERIQALRLIRRLLVLSPADFPPALTRSLVALANGGAEEKDRMLRACLGVLTEICVLNPDMFVSCGGVSALLRNIAHSQMPRIVECLCGALLFLLDRPSTRRHANVQLQSLAVPYCDFHWDSDRNREDREARFLCVRLALLSVLRSWPGILHFCHPSNSSGLQAIVSVLYLKQLEVRKAILDLLYDLLGLPQPEWTDEFSVALEAVDPSHPQDIWRLSEGFVAAEGKAVLPHLAKFRPNIVEIHLSVLLYTFLEAGLLDAIVEVIVTSDTFISVRATILLGELLQLIHLLLPPECCNITPPLPNLMVHASNAANLPAQHLALTAVEALSHLHHLLKRRPAPASLFLDQVLQAGGWLRPGVEQVVNSRGKHEKAKLYQLIMKDGDEALKDSAVLSNKDGFSWNWNIVRAVLKTRNDALCKLEDSNHRTFLKRLVHYFKPSSNRFSRVELGNKKQTQMYTLAGCELLDCLLEIDEPEGSKLLTELLSDISTNIDVLMTSKSAHDCFFSPHHVTSSVCQDYFLFIGRLCRSSKGMRMLDKSGIFQVLLNLVVSTNHDCYVKLVVSSLDYTTDAMPRVILSKVLTASTVSSRLYATQFLLVLLRAKLPDFQKWGVELLVNQLYDQSKAVSLVAITILEEATEEKLYLESVIALRPSLLHLGDKGLLLLIRFLSTPTGFTFLQDANFVSNELERWSTNFNYRYVRLIEGDIHDSFTLHQRGEDGRYSRRITNAKHCIRDVFVPPHLYGQLVQHDKGFQLLLKEGKLENIFQIIHSRRCSSEQDILELKAALWGCGHIATFSSGVKLLAEEGIIVATVQLAETCPVYCVRGTALYVLALMGTTRHGATELNRAGWLCVRHHRHDRWPVIEQESNEDYEGSLAASETDNMSLSSGTESDPSKGPHRQSVMGHFYISDEAESVTSADDEGLLLDESSVSAHWIDTPGTRAPHKSSHQRKSQTLPHSRPTKSIIVPRHIRSLSESKQSQIPQSPLQPGEWPSEVRARDMTLQPPGAIPRVDDTKSRSNSCTDSSGVSSCDSGLGRHVISERIQTLSPIPSSASLSTLKSAGIPGDKTRKMSVQSSTTSEGLAVSPDVAHMRLSQQDLLGYATLRSLKRHCRPMYSDTSILATAELIGFDDHGASKVRSLDRQFSQTILCEFESSSPPPLLGRSSVGAKPYIGSRSNITSKLSVAPRDGGSQQCYMGISLPRVLSDLYPAADKPVVDKKRSAREPSFSEMEQVQEVVEVSEESSSSDSEGLDGPSKAHLRSTSSHHRHVSTHCLSCWRLRDRKISTGSHHWYRTDTDSSVGGGDSPVLVPRRRKSHSTGSGVLCLTPGGSLDSNKSLDAGSSLPAEEQDTILSKSLTRKQILRHVGRMSNPVWGKQSRQALLQLKQKFPSSFQDVCLYSEVCHRMSVASYRLVARRFIQELFLDLTFDMLYDEPASILQMENTSVATSSPLHGQEVTEVPSALVKSPPLEVVREEAPSLESCVYSVLSVEGVGSSRQSNRSTRTNIVSSSEDAFKVSPNYNISNVNSLSGVVGDPLCSETTKISSDRSSTDTDIPNTSFLIAEDINKNTLESISCRYLNKDQSTSCSNPGSLEPTAGTKPRTLSRATEVNTLKLFKTNSSPQQTVQSKHLQSLYEFESAINTVVKAKNLELWNTPHSDNIGVGINNVRNMSGDSCVVESDVSKERCVFVDLMGAGDGSSEDCNVQVPLLVITTTAFIAPVFDNTATCVVSNPRTGSSTPQGAPRRDHISPRNRKLATSLPPNISTLAKTSSNLVPTCIASTIAKNVHQVPVLPPSESQTKSGESVHNKK